MTDLVFHALAAKVHAATEPSGLASIFCNEPHVLADCRQAALVGFLRGRRAQLVSHSGPVEVDAASPYARWLADVADHIRQHLDALAPAARVLALSPAMLPPAHRNTCCCRQRSPTATPGGRWPSAGAPSPRRGHPLGARRVLRWALSVVPLARTWQKRG